MVVIIESDYNVVSQTCSKGSSLEPKSVLYTDKDVLYVPFFLLLLLFKKSVQQQRAVALICLVEEKAMTFFLVP